jgi:hypothetical protein
MEIYYLVFRFVTACINVSGEYTDITFKIEHEDVKEMYLRNLGTHLVHYTIK